MVLYHPKKFNKIDRGTRRHRLFAGKVRAYSVVEAKGKAAAVARKNNWTVWGSPSEIAPGRATEAMYKGWPHSPDKAR